MNLLTSKETIKELINNNKMLLLYFSNNTCGVCHVLKPKVEKLLKNYPEIKSYQIDLEKSLEIAAEYSIFTIPAILVFIEGKEIIREARFISIQDMESKINRCYNMVFGE